MTVSLRIAVPSSQLAGVWGYQTVSGDGPSPALCEVSAAACSSFLAIHASTASRRIRCMPPAVMIAGVWPVRLSLCQVLRLMPIVWQKSAIVIRCIMSISCAFHRFGVRYRTKSCTTKSTLAKDVFFYCSHSSLLFYSGHPLLLKRAFCSYFFFSLFLFFLFSRLINLLNSLSYRTKCEQSRV